MTSVPFHSHPLFIFARDPADKALSYAIGVKRSNCARAAGGFALTAPRCDLRRGRLSKRAREKSLIYFQPADKLPGEQEGRVRRFSTGSSRRISSASTSPLHQARLFSSVQFLNNAGMHRARARAYNESVPLTRTSRLAGPYKPDSLARYSNSILSWPLVLRSRSARGVDEVPL